MHIMQRLARGLASVAFKFCILLAAITAAAAMTFGTPGTFKQALAESKLYDRLVDATLEQIKKGNKTPAQAAQGGEDMEKHIPLDDAAIEQIAHKAFPPALVRSSIEQIIDGVYNWLGGESTQPDFSADLAPVKQNLANAIGDEAVRRVQTLPVCTPEQLKGLTGADIKAFELTCIPPGLNLQAERQKIVDEVMGSQDFLIPSSPPAISKTTRARRHLKPSQTPHDCSSGPIVSRGYSAAARCCRPRLCCSCTRTAGAGCTCWLAPYWLLASSCSPAHC